MSKWLGLRRYPAPSEIPWRETTRALGLTQSITWGFTTDTGFTYELRVLSANRDEDEPDTCSAGVSAPSPGVSTTDGVVVRHTQRSLTAYTNYRFCVRATNDDGNSGWAMSNSEPTLPGTPSNPTYRSSESEVSTHATGTHIVKRLFWSVAQSATAPRDEMKYDVQVIRSTERTVATANRNDVCETQSSITALSETIKYAVVADGDVVTRQRPHGDRDHREQANDGI